MILTATSIEGVYIIDAQETRDDRGSFARIFDAPVLAALKLVDRFDFHSIATNERAGTIRGLHFQAKDLETKIVRCTAGAIFDVAVDLRASSPTFAKWFGVRLDAVNHRALYIPAGCAHGYQTLEDRSAAVYLIDVPYNAARARGVYHADATIGISWPHPITLVSPRDDALPPLERSELP